jgi:hypothetical protein
MTKAMNMPAPHLIMGLSLPVAEADQPAASVEFNAEYIRP